MNSDFVKVINGSRDPITVSLYYRRRRGAYKRPKSFTLKPGEESEPVPRDLLIAGEGWDELRANKEVTIEPVRYDPRYIRLENQSTATVELTLKVPRPKSSARIPAITLGPREISRIVDVKTLKRPSQLKKLMRNKQISVQPVFDIAPPWTSRAAGWSYGESVYTCDICGGPIVFRYNPPKPIHI
jgi:hypothetical protein